ncbi:MAG: hypothetical protein AAFO69_10710 [Bacteroidota bacterium]
MSLFTRKVRNQQMTKGKLFKYLSYALGEVLLIVIGVLVAVKINSGVAASKNQTAVESTYLQLYKDLREDIEKSDQLLRHYARKDSLIYEVMYDQVTAEDYLNDDRFHLRTIVTSYQLLIIQDQSFKSLLALNDKITVEQDTLLRALKQLYFDRKSSVDGNNEYMTRLVQKNIDWLKFNTDWLSNFYYLDQPLTPTQLDFYQHSDVYKNLLTEYSQTGPGNHVRSVLAFRRYAKQVYRQLAKQLARTDTLLYDAADYRQFLGEYQTEETSTEIFSKNNQLYMGGEEDYQQVIPLNDYSFTTEEGGFYYGISDSTAQKYGIELRYRGQKYFLKKETAQK